MVAGLPENSSHNELTSPEGKIAPLPAINHTRNNSQAETHDTSRNDISRFFDNVKIQTQRNQSVMNFTSSSDAFEDLVSEGKRTRDTLMQKFKGLEVFIDKIIKDQIERKEYNIQRESLKSDSEFFIPREAEVLIPNETSFDNKKAQVKFNVLGNTSIIEVYEGDKGAQIGNKVMEFSFEINANNKEGQIAKAEGEVDDFVDDQVEEITQEKTLVITKQRDDKLEEEKTDQLSTKKTPKKGFNFRVNNARIELMLQTTARKSSNSEENKQHKENESLTMIKETEIMAKKENNIEEEEKESVAKAKTKTPKGFNFRVNNKKIDSILKKGQEINLSTMINEQKDNQLDNKIIPIEEVEIKRKEFENSQRKALQGFEKYEDFLGKIEGWREEGNKLKGFNFRNPNRIKAD